MLTKTALISFLLITTSFVQNVSATILPDSSYGWQGRAEFDDGLNAIAGDIIPTGLEGYVEFAVYDSLDSALDGDEFDFINSVDENLDINGQYIYAYQIYLDTGSSNIVDYFAVLGIGDNAIESSNDIGSLADSPDYGEESFPGAIGIEPDSEGFSVVDGNYSRGYWLFDGGDFAAGENSWFLLIGSDSAPKWGTYTFKPLPTDDIVIPDDIDIVASNPEPGTFALLAFGSALLMKRKRSFA